MTKRLEDLPPLAREIVEEGLRWVRENKDTHAEVGYSSPRVSSEIPDCSMPLTFDQYSYCSLGCMYCALGHTLIALPGISKKIEDVEAGDTVFSRNLETGEIELDTVTSTMQRTTRSIIDITLENGKILSITPEHPVYVNGRGWVPAGELVEGDDLDVSKRPDQSYRQTVDNVMKDPSTAKKVGDSLRAGFASGSLDGLKQKLTESGRRNLIAYNKRASTRAMVSERMLNNNPMHDPETAKHVGEVLKTKFATGELQPYWSGKKKPDAVKRMLTNNPMKDPIIRKETLRKIVASWKKNGKESKGERRVKSVLKTLGVSFIHQATVEGPNGRDFILDFLLPDFQTCIEYDGHSRHYTEEGMEHDKGRDAWLVTSHGLKTIRIHRDKAFIPHEELCDSIRKAVGI